MESSVGEDGDETGDSIVMARDEVTVLLEEGFFPIVEVECEVWQRGELVAAEQVDSEFDVSTVGWQPRRRSRRAG
ncbi:hypothetical protein glysoja_040066 [Glycine soja]|uniref:Uncharacterized protein n=1 Tax=Glycine soja TaxID=3848 RepID=A0A0B2SLG4_GLYSO|nr:hypothetical protein glysoja_040066 [Glycine soja]